MGNKLAGLGAFVGTAASTDEVGAAPGGRGPTSRLERAEQRNGLWFTSPWLIGLTLFYLVPLVASFVMSFTDFELVDSDDSGTNFVGFDNWSRLFRDPDVVTSAGVTVRFALLFLPTSILVPLLFAYVLTARHLWGRSVFRVLFFAPTIIPFISSVFVWQGYLNPQDGWLNRILATVGIDGPDWLNSTFWILPSLDLIALWGVGNAMVIFMAALNGVPVDLYEAATLDGAGRWHLFRHVTWPMISPVTFYNIIIALVALGQYFLVPFALTNGTGDPDESALFYTMYFYRQTFSFFNAGYGATLAWAMFAAVSVFTGFLFWSAKYWVHTQYQERS
ncbi:MAG: sugar ABC transporter permease [Actinomycetota bacterium]|nr:sugar ABC transporter permease [Actinomycetota bacterium]